MLRRPRPSTPVRLLLSTVLILVAAGCGVPEAPEPAAPPASPTAGPTGIGIGPVPTATPAAEPAGSDFPTPHPRFAEHFADPLYHDEGDELAPFGSDEGWDTLYTWAERRDELTSCTTVRSMFAEEDGSLAEAMEEASGEDPAADGAIVGVGFTLLFYTGHIDAEGKRLVLDAIRREARYYDDETVRELPVLLRDLESFPATTCAGFTPLP